MSEQKVSTIGQFSWYELNTSDIKGALDFYTHVIGWTYEGALDGPRAYPHLKASMGHLGGVTLLPEEAKKMGAPPHWMAYVNVADVDQKTKEATDLGAKVYVPAMDIPGTGRFSVIADPQGGVIALFKGEKDEPLNDSSKHGEFNWRELATSDNDAAFAFYSKLFGWEHKGDFDMGPMGNYILFGLGDKQMGGMMKRPKEMPVTAWLYYVMVDDLDAATKRAQDKGGKLLNGPMPVPGGARIVQLLDPQGAMFALVGM